jgi:HAD superfamily hydrolase (TIGR01450 family)
MNPTGISFSGLRQRHHAILLDAYGVLVDASGALPGAANAIASMRRDGQPFLVVTNDASRSAARAASRLQGLGLDVTPDHILSSGMLIEPALREVGDAVRRVVVLGTTDSADYARAAGVDVVEPSMHEPADAVVVADEGGFDFLSTMDEVLSMTIEAARLGRTPRLFLANPDLIYPSGKGTFGFTAGSLALMLERALDVVLGSDAPKFEILGKPSPRIFNEAIARVGTRDAVMIGDQLHTDIAGAQSVGIASALLLGGVSHQRAAQGFGEWTPTYLLRSL